jgi:putative FmdB family regulatory protein
MPIYEYQCQACGYREDILQKISDKPIVKCPKCSANKMTKLVSAPSFQLKGQGWYVTDFRDKDKKATESKSTSESTTTTKTEPTKASTETTTVKSSESKTTEKKKTTE